MKHFNVIIFILLLSFTLGTAARAGEVWRITSLDWQPYSDSQSSTLGKSVEKLRSLLKNEGIDLIVEFYPWARAQDIAQQDGYVGYFPAAGK